jgi:hypothetical protein
VSAWGQSLTPPPTTHLPPPYLTPPPSAHDISHCTSRCRVAINSSQFFGCIWVQCSSAAWRTWHSFYAYARMVASPPPPTNAPRGALRAVRFHRQSTQSQESNSRQCSRQSSSSQRAQSRSRAPEESRESHSHSLVVVVAHSLNGQWLAEAKSNNGAAIAINSRPCAPSPSSW